MVTDANGKEITSPNHIGNINPIRYRGYYCDTETGLYYLQSRYYNPTVGRFLNADIYCDTQSSILGTNMFAYCDNNPINFYDFNGYGKVGNWLKKAWNSVKTWAGNTFGAGTSSYIVISDNVASSNYGIFSIKSGSKSTKTTYSSGDSSKPISVYSRISIDDPIKSSFVGLKLNISDFTIDLSLGLDNLGISGSLRNGNTTNSLGLKANLTELSIGFEQSISTLLEDITEAFINSIFLDLWFVLTIIVLVFSGGNVQLQSSSPSPVPGLRPGLA